MTCTLHGQKDKKNRNPRIVIIPVQRYNIFFNILFTVKLNEDVGGGTVIAPTSDEYVYVPADYIHIMRRKRTRLTK